MLRNAHTDHTANEAGQFEKYLTYTRFEPIILQIYP